VLSNREQNWREGDVVLIERPIAERYAELQMQVRDRDQEPWVVLREHFCPRCAASLAVDVSTEGTPPAKVCRPFSLSAVGSASADHDPAGERPVEEVR
jgi:acetone carboxylase gamma subunit